MNNINKSSHVFSQFEKMPSHSRSKIVKEINSYGNTIENVCKQKLDQQNLSPDPVKKLNTERIGQSTFYRSGKNHLLNNSTTINEKPLMKQIDVLYQIDDTTISGFENCGYHALKNTICLLASLKSEGFFSEAFKDPELFHQFYERYALPILKNLARGKRDATTPLLREIIHSFISDPTPPANFLKLQEILTKNKKHLGIFTVFPSSNEEGLQFGLLDKEGFEDVLKLIRFLKNKHPGFFVCPVGNVNTGHWYAIAILREKDGSLEFYGCDSLEPHQKGEASPLGKICSLFENSSLDSDDFLNTSLSSFVETFELYGDWLDSKGKPYEPENREILIKLSETLPELCILALKLMIEQQWPASSNIQHHLQLHKIEKLLRFFGEHSVNRLVIGKIVADLGAQFDFDQAIDLLMKKQISALESKAKYSVGSEERSIQKMKTIFEHMRIIYNKRKMIVSKENETSRENVINEMMCAGIEKGFVAGKNAMEAQKCLEHRTLTLLMTSQKAKTLNKEKEFYETIMKGDPCLTDCMGRIENFLGSLCNLGDFLQDLQTDVVFKQIDAALSILLQDMVDDVKDLNKITAQDINPDDLALILKSFTGPTIVPFKEYLVRMKYCENIENIEWKAVVNQLLKSSDFTMMLIRGKAIAKQYY